MCGKKMKRRIPFFCQTSFCQFFAGRYPSSDAKREFGEPHPEKPWQKYVRQKYEKEEFHFSAKHFFVSSFLAVILHPVRSVNLANPIQKAYGKNMCGKNMKEKNPIFLPNIFLSVLFWPLSFILCEA
jgi:hypothetical protein